ncbi:oxidoreductase [Novosphingobium endophyticum]|uniref:Oxidoreductase n=1 Tax=Novosphingobium endophyticum TaxID=1955250 RepID=A0A916TSN7_9SPHN|nr:SDR family NAD(P)-dependent oxidoreductase [Novosphingobium endophyticum]GGB97622.1 oxidoreductase [Novosphingobium endophyticum]
MDSLFGLSGKRILVIGGGQGMGEATATLLAKLGCGIAVLDLECERAEKVAQKLRATGGAAYSIAADVTDEMATERAIDRAEREFGPLDGMVSVVGMAGWGTLLELSAETWDGDHRRNLRYFFFAAREIARRLIERKTQGTIVAVASVDGLRSAPNHAAYGAAKAGLINLVKTMATEWAEAGIRVNCIAPGGIVTPRIPLGSRAREREGMARVPMKRRGEVDDIAKAAAFFLSDLSPYVTGQTLAVDGGYTAAGGFSDKSAAPAQGTIGLAPPPAA